jgi:hypothetical protein
MSNDRSVLERQMERVELRPFTLEGFHHRRQRKERNRRIGTAVVALGVAAAAFASLARALTSDRGTVPADQPSRRFVGTWTSTDVDGSSQTMTIGAAEEGGLEIVVRDDSAGVCSGAPSTMTGTGRLDGARQLVIPSPVLTCDDGSEPVVPEGPPLEEQLRNLTFVHDPRAATLTDSFEVLWQREGATTSGGTWPQSSVEEVAEAQRLADAGNPRYTWQVDAELAAGANAGDAEIVARFFEEKLGWQGFRGEVGGHGGGYGVTSEGRATWEGVFVRCAPGRTNPLYPNDPEGRGCAPTIDQFRYETVKIKVAQLVRGGPSGIWVVVRWEMLPPSDEPMTNGEESFTQRQIEQVAPPTDGEATALLQAFLQARIDGEGAQEFLRFPEDGEIPLLYATTSGAPYERSEIELIEGPVWPLGQRGFKIRLFAEGDETVVEQFIEVDRDETGPLMLEYWDWPGPSHPLTTENGQPVAEPYSYLDGVIFSAAPPWRERCLLGPCSLDHDNLQASLYVLADPRPVETGCLEGPAPANAEALAGRIRSDPDLEATEPVAVPVGGTPALRMDVVAAPGASVCQNWGGVGVVTETGDPVVLGGGHRMRLYLLDLPEGLSARILTIAIVAPEPRFERVVETATPIVDSFQFRTR